MTRITLMIAALAALAGCQTVEGFGQDVETAGEEIQEESNQAQY